MTAAQQTRLIQIDLQWEGPAALASRASLAEALALTPEQLQTLRAAVAACRREADQPQAEHRLAQRALAVLKPEQRDRWKAMLGQPFAVGKAVAAAPGNPVR